MLRPTRCDKPAVGRMRVAGAPDVRVLYADCISCGRRLQGAEGERRALVDEGRGGDGRAGRRVLVAVGV